MKRALFGLFSVFLMAATASTAFAAPGHDGGHANSPIGKAGDPKKVSRTIEVVMNDRMRFLPDKVTVKPGETIRFVVRNSGRLLHELVIGTPEELRAHAELMKKHPGMEHDEPYMAHVAAGRRGELVWHFNRPGTFQFACLLPGHFEAGMVGTLVVTPVSPEKKP